MSEIAYRPRSVAEIVDASIQLFRHNFRELVTIMAIGYVPWIAASTIFSRARDGAAPGEAAAMMSDLTGVLLLLVGGVWFAVVSAACTAAASDRYLGIEVDVARSLRRAFARALPVMLTALITWLVTALGAVLLLIPGAYFFAKYALSSTVALLEDVSTGGALRRASDLSTGRKLPILGAMLAAWAIYLAIALTVGAVVGVLGASWLQPLAEAAISVGVAPIIAVVSAVLYYDLRIRREGYDVELLERQLQPAPEPV